MAPLGPWDAERRVAVAVSGGGDSMALCLLAARWGRPLALIVDHGLRHESAAEAELTADRLAARGIAARVLALSIAPGPRLAERARAARYAVLSRACAEAGLADLLLGHHAGDQAETALLRARHGSGPAGLAGMAPVRATGPVRLLRPLLGVAPERLRATLRAAGLAWVEDPSNGDPRAERTRLRRLLAWADGHGPASLGLRRAAAVWSAHRCRAEAAVAAELAEHASLRPEGFAVLGAPVSEAALSALVRMIGGAAYPPSPAAVARLADVMRAGGSATLAGVRLLPAGRLGPGHLLVREAAACAPPAAAPAPADGRIDAGPPVAGAREPGVLDAGAPKASAPEFGAPAPGVPGAGASEADAPGAGAPESGALRDDVLRDDVLWDDVLWDDVLWDGRFRRPAGAPPAPPGWRIGALGAAARRLRRHGSLPAAVLASLPAWWEDENLRAVPHLCYPDAQMCERLTLLFDPPRPATDAIPTLEPVARDKPGAIRSG
jgi:tRNA(Ile)-lysidine synthase